MTALPFLIEERVRWSDVDAAGIIFYGAYVRFFELAETELFRSVGLSYGLMFDQYDMYLPRVQVHTDFHYPARLDDTLEVAAFVERVGQRSITMHFDVIHQGLRRLTADGHLVLVATDRERIASRPLPEDFVQRLVPHTLSVAEARGFIGLKVPGP